MDEITAFYNRYWVAEGGAPPERDLLIERKWKDLAKHIRRGNRVLDYGCGGGLFSRRLVDAGCEVLGLDIAQKAIELARSRVPGADFKLIRSGEPLPVVDSGFDVVWASQILEHVYDTQTLMNEFARVLRPRGELIVTVPYHGLLKNLTIALFRFDRHFRPTGAHIRFFTRKTLITLAKEAGFKCEEFLGLARIPGFWKSMFMRFKKSA